MTVINRLKSGVLVAAAIAIPIVSNGCSEASKLQDAACCSEFKVGADMSTAEFGVDADIKGQFYAFVQSSSDFAAAATAMTNDVAIACQGIATDLGTDPGDPKFQSLTGTTAMNTWCDEAVARLDANAAFKAAGKAQIVFDPPVCTASVSAQANCQAHCDVSGKCDIKATPPKCEGGKLTVSCDGKCTASAGASVSCTGSCEGSCSGSCEAQGGVQCAGSCEGTCEGAGGAGTNGTQADGTCKGTCKGKCSVVPPGVKCTGTCSGKCDASCTGTATAKVQCDGTCTGTAEPIKCEGGKLTGGCNVDADCQANCSASASAKAECTPPAVRVQFEGQASLSADLQVQIGTVIHSLEVHLPQLLVAIQARGKLLIDLSTPGKAGSIIDAAGHVAGNTGKLGVKGVVCAAIVVDTLGAAAGNAAASVSAGAKVTGKLGL